MNFTAKTRFILVMFLFRITFLGFRIDLNHSAIFDRCQT